MKMINVEALAKILGVSIVYARALCRKQKIKATKIGRDWILTKEDAYKFLKEWKR